MDTLPSSKKPHCLYCGNNPTNHAVSYVAQSILVLGLPLASAFSFMMRPFFLHLMHNTMVTWSTKSLELLHLVTFSDDATKACSDRSAVIWEEAKKRGIHMQQMIISSKPVEQYRAYMHNRWYYFTSLPIPPYLDQRSYLSMDSKIWLKKKLLEHTVRVPQGGSAYTWKQAEAIFNRVQKPVIVKPANGSRGRHSLTHLSTLADLRHGYTVAKQLCCSVVVEEHLKGSVYRATYVGGKIAGVLRGDPPRVQGDGVSTITQLIEEKNATKPTEVKEVQQSEVITECIARQGYTYDSILPAGTKIDLLEKIGLSYGGDAVEDFTITHPKLLEQLKKAGDVLGAPIVGFDFISEDITKDPDTVRWGIIEANSMPFIDLHHDPRKGEPINVAAMVWDLWKK